MPAQDGRERARVNRVGSSGASAMPCARARWWLLHRQEVGRTPCTAVAPAPAPRQRLRRGDAARRNHRQRDGAHGWSRQRHGAEPNSRPPASKRAAMPPASMPCAQIASAPPLPTPSLPPLCRGPDDKCATPLQRRDLLPRQTTEGEGCRRRRSLHQCGELRRESFRPLVGNALRRKPELFRHGRIRSIAACTIAGSGSTGSRMKRFTAKGRSVAARMAATALVSAGGESPAPASDPMPRPATTAIAIASVVAPSMGA